MNEFTTTELIFENLKSIMKKGTIQIYIDGNNQLRWSLNARNGRTIADCSKGYKSRRSLNAGLAYQSEYHRVIDDSGNQRINWPFLGLYLKSK